MIGVLLCWFVGLVVLVQEIIALTLAALVGTVQNIFFLSVLQYFHFVPIAKQAGQPVMPGRLSIK